VKLRHTSDLLLIGQCTTWTKKTTCSEKNDNNFFVFEKEASKKKKTPKLHVVSIKKGKCQNKKHTAYTMRKWHPFFSTCHDNLGVKYVHGSAMYCMGRKTTCSEKNDNNFFVFKKEASKKKKTRKLHVVSIKKANVRIKAETHT